MAKKVKTIEEVYDGFKNLIWKNHESEILARERFEICKKCKHFKSYIGFYMGCEMCGCYVPAKVRAIKSNCPIGEWKGFTKKEYNKVYGISYSNN